MHRHNKKLQGHPVRPIEGHPNRYEAYFRTLPTSCNVSAVVRTEVWHVYKYIETDREGFLLNDLDEVLSSVSLDKRIRTDISSDGNKRRRMRLEAEENALEEERDRAAAAALEKRRQREQQDAIERRGNPNVQRKLNICDPNILLDIGESISINNYKGLIIGIEEDVIVLLLYEPIKRSQVGDASSFPALKLTSKIKKVCSSAKEMFNIAVYNSKEVDSSYVSYFTGIKDVFEVAAFDDDAPVQFRGTLMETSASSKAIHMRRNNYRQPDKNLEDFAALLLSEPSIVTTKERYRYRSSLVLSWEQALRTCSRDEGRISFTFPCNSDFIKNFLAAIIRLQSHIDMKKVVESKVRVFPRAEHQFGSSWVSKESIPSDVIEVNLNVHELVPYLGCGVVRQFILLKSNGINYSNDSCMNVVRREAPAIVSINRTYSILKFSIPVQRMIRSPDHVLYPFVDLFSKGLSSRVGQIFFFKASKELVVVVREEMKLVSTKTKDVLRHRGSNKMCDNFILCKLSASNDVITSLLEGNDTNVFGDIISTDDLNSLRDPSPLDGLRLAHPTLILSKAYTDFIKFDFSNFSVYVKWWLRVIIKNKLHEEGTYDILKNSKSYISAETLRHVLNVLQLNSGDIENESSSRDNLTCFHRIVQAALAELV
jgi:hypothetical protein